MSLTFQQRRAADSLRALGFGDRRIAEKLEIGYKQVRKDREQRLIDFEPEQAAAEGKVDGYTQEVIIPDTQWPWSDPDAEAVILEYIERNQPEGLLHIGDGYDFYSLARFAKNMPPEDRMYLTEELRIGEEKLAEYSRVSPNAKRRRYIKGNHETRLDRYLDENAPELFGLIDDALSFENITRLNKYGWDVVAEYGEGCWVGQPGSIWATHGDFARKWSGASAKAHVLEKYGISVIHGHTHRLGAFYHTRHRFGEPETLIGVEAGTLASFSKTPRAEHIVDWQHGFIVIWCSENSPRFHVDVVSIHDGGTLVNGVKYGR